MGRTPSPSPLAGSRRASGRGHKPSHARGEPRDGAGAKPRALLRAARAARADRSPADVAAASGVSQEALRTTETGRVPTPAFFTVAAVAGALDVPLDRLLADLAAPADDAALTA